jgi:ribosomal protein L7/L12
MRERHDVITMQAIARVERKLDLIMQHLEISDYAPAEPDPLTEVREHIRAGKKIQAIKVYRELTGVGLKEAKDAVERMEAGY